MKSKVEVHIDVPTKGKKLCLSLKIHILQMFEVFSQSKFYFKKTLEKM